ncbi:122_t:CDS:2, partial [Funneliformis mosseae]
IEYSNVNLSSDVEALINSLLHTRFIRRDLKLTDNKPLGMKVDRMFCSSNEQGYEIGIVILKSCNIYVSGFYIVRDIDLPVFQVLKILWNFKIYLDNTIEILKKFKKSHRKNATIDKQSFTLKNIIKKYERFTKKTDGKNITYLKSSLL